MQVLLLKGLSIKKALLQFGFCFYFRIIKTVVMKKFSLFFISLLFLINSFSQTQTNSKEYYELKSKHQKTTAWIMLGGGAGLFIAGGVVGAHGFFDLFSGDFNKANNNVGAAATLGIVGTASMLGSIPFFISSGKNARKAASISFIDERILLPQQNTIAFKMQPTISLKISL